MLPTTTTPRTVSPTVPSQGNSHGSKTVARVEDSLRGYESLPLEVLCIIARYCQTNRCIIPFSEVNKASRDAAFMANAIRVKLSTFNFFDALSLASAWGLNQLRTLTEDTLRCFLSEVCLLPNNYQQYKKLIVDHYEFRHNFVDFGLAEALPKTNIEELRIKKYTAIAYFSKLLELRLLSIGIVSLNSIVTIEDCHKLSSIRCNVLEGALNLRNNEKLKKIIVEIIEVPGMLVLSNVQFLESVEINYLYGLFNIYDCSAVKKVTIDVVCNMQVIEVGRLQNISMIELGEVYGSTLDVFQCDKLDTIDVEILDQQSSIYASDCPMLRCIRVKKASGIIDISNCLKITTLWIDTWFKGMELAMDDFSSLQYIKIGTLIIDSAYISGFTGLVTIEIEHIPEGKLLLIENCPELIQLNIFKLDGTVHVRNCPKLPFVYLTCEGPKSSYTVH